MIMLIWLSLFLLETALGLLTRYCVHMPTGTGVARIFVWVGGHLADATSHASVAHSFEAVAGSWGSVSAPAVNRVMGRATE